MLEAKRIRVTAGGNCLLDDVSLTVGPGEFVALIGPNGAGKSTLLKVLSGGLKPLAGTVRLGGRDLRARTEERSQTLAVLSQQAPLNFSFTAFEVVGLGRLPHRGQSSKAEDERIAWESLKTVGMEHAADRLFPTLSGGEKQRVQLARALAQIGPEDARNRYLLLDEPTSSLDVTYQHVALSAARKLCEKSTGVVAVLHDLNLAALFATRVVLLDQGRVVIDDIPAKSLAVGVLQPVFRVPEALLPQMSTF